ncbi:putative DNA-dependent DNA helicase and ATPase-like protein, partial [Operophtera brumata]
VRGESKGGEDGKRAARLLQLYIEAVSIHSQRNLSNPTLSLLEAMEQGRVSVAKGGVVCSLAARATVLAAANPAGGSYNRFDLIFILLDQPNEKMDAMLSEHVLALHSGQKGRNTTKSTNLNGTITTSQNNDETSLSQRLRLRPGEEIDHLPLVLLRKYIAYARRYVHPKLSSDAANARARVDLREEATAKDANDVISLVKHSLIDTFSDEFGNIQLSRSINGSGVSSRSKLKKFLDVLTRRAHQIGKDIFTKHELIALHKEAGVAGNPNDLIEALHIHSYLLLKGSNTYQLII